MIPQALDADFDIPETIVHRWNQLHTSGVQSQDWNRMFVSCNTCKSLVLKDYCQQHVAHVDCRPHFCVSIRVDHTVSWPSLPNFFTQGSRVGFTPAEANMLFAFCPCGVYIKRDIAPHRHDCRPHFNAMDWEYTDFN